MKTNNVLEAPTTAYQNRNEYILFIDGIIQKFYDLKEAFWFYINVNGDGECLIVDVENRIICLQQNYPPFGFINLFFADDLIFSILEKNAKLENVRFMVETIAMQSKPENFESKLIEMKLRVLTIQEF